MQREFIFDCLIINWGQEQSIPLEEVSNYIWYAYISKIRPGKHYRFLVHGLFDLTKGYRFNSKKLLIDSYAKASTAEAEHKEALFSYPGDCEEQELTASEIDDG
jgi:isoamylase